ncbi:MAG TPA: TlpA disulfide reductase family protein [Polyangiaceae bacterium]|jgi:peroxiredoxin
MTFLRGAKHKKLLDLGRYVLFGVALYLLATELMRHASGPKEGTTAAKIDLPLATRPERFELAQMKGKAVLVEVFASWCSACRRSAPSLADAWRAHHDQNVTFLGVSVDENAAAARTIQADWGIPFDVAIDDGSVSRDYGIRMLPTLIYIDAQGVVRHTRTGIPSRAELESWLAER